MMLSRRGLIAASLAAAGTARAEPKPDALNLYAHRIHKIVAVEGQGGDITAAWTKRTGVKVNWVTFETAPLEERLFREASLSETSVDIGFLLNTQITERMASLFEPLDTRLRDAPLEDPGDIFPGLVRGMQVGGVSYGVPFRHSSSGLHYNTTLLAECGINEPPKTIEAMIETAKKCTYTRPDGSKVVGFVMGGLGYADIIAFARAWDGDYITQDMRVVADQPPMLTAVRALRDLYASGALPRNLTTINGEDVNLWMQTGRAAMIIGAMGRNAIYNDPNKSRFPGAIKTIPLPVSKDLLGKYPVAPTKVEFWGMAIPRSAQHKDLAWDLIRAMLSKDATVMAALSGNGPVRQSAYDDPRIRAALPFAEAEREVLKVSRVAIPAFTNAAKAGDLLQEEVQAAVLGMKSPEQAMHDLVERTKPLIG
jgi:multiple sugar transport system substrate-binding protein